jgi:hypothetical protein
MGAAPARAIHYLTATATGEPVVFTGKRERILLAYPAFGPEFFLASGARWILGPRQQGGVDDGVATSFRDCEMAGSASSSDYSCCPGCSPAAAAPPLLALAPFATKEVASTGNDSCRQEKSRTLR